MKIKIIICILVYGLLVFSFNSCSCVKLHEGDCMILNGVAMYSKGTEVVQDSSIVPNASVNIKDLLVNLGWSWEVQESKVYIQKNASKFVLDLDTKSIAQHSDTGNADAQIVDFVIQNETIIVSDITAESLASFLREKIYISTFENDKKVYITSVLTEEEQNSYNVVLDGKKINIASVYKLYSQKDESTFVRVLPLLDILRECGFDVEVQGKNAKIKTGVKTYTLNMADGSLLWLGQSFYPDLAGDGELLFMTSDENQFYCSSPIARAIMERMINVKLYDTESGVYIILQK